MRRELFLSCELFWMFIGRDGLIKSCEELNGGIDSTESLSPAKKS